MRARTIAVAGTIASASLCLYGFSAGSANATNSGHGSVALHAATSHSTAHATALPKGINKGAKCGSGFGTELSTPDGLIAWNDTSGTGFNTAGAADVTCSGKAKKRKIHKVSVYGYFGTAPTDQFNVTFYSNDPTDGSNEPDDSTDEQGDGTLCDYTGITGAAGGQYPTHVLTVLTLPTVCKLPKGEVWVAVQNNDSAGPWYWEMQQEQQGDAPDWRDVNNLFGSGCITFDGNDSGTNGGDEYLLQCLGYDYGDFMLLLQ
jgi:hypothetical protein